MTEVSGVLPSWVPLQHAHVRHYVAESVTLEGVDDAITLRSIGKRQSVTVVVPHSDASSYHTLVSTSECDVDRGC